MPLAVAVRKNILNIYPTAPTCFLTPTWCGESVFAHGMIFSSFQSNNNSWFKLSTQGPPLMTQSVTSPEIHQNPPWERGNIWAPKTLPCPGPKWDSQSQTWREWGEGRWPRAIFGFTSMSLSLLDKDFPMFCCNSNQMGFFLIFFFFLN